MFHLAHQVTTITEITSSPCILANSCLRKQKNYSWGRCDINARQPALTLLQNKLESSALWRQMATVVPLLPAVAAKNSAALILKPNKAKNESQIWSFSANVCLASGNKAFVKDFSLSPSSVAHLSIYPMYLWHRPIKNISQLLPSLASNKKTFYLFIF